MSCTPVAMDPPGSRVLAFHPGELCIQLRTGVGFWAEFGGGIGLTAEDAR